MSNRKIRYLKDSEKKDSDKICWQEIIGQTLKQMLLSVYYDTEILGIDKEMDSIVSPLAPVDLLLVPFHNEHNELCGLDLIRRYRIKHSDYATPALFLLTTQYAEPNVFNVNEKRDPYLTALLGNPKFGNTDKATLYAEIIYDYAHSDSIEIKNFTLLKRTRNYINELNDSIDDLCTYGDIYNLPKATEFKKGKLREIFYDTYVRYYDYNLIRNIEEFKSFDDDAIENKFKQAYSLYCALNKINNTSHSVGNDLFIAPLPFRLIDFVHARNELFDIIGRLGEAKNKNIKLRLVDNKPEDKEPALNHIFDLFGLEPIVKLKPVTLDIEKTDIEKDIYPSLKNAHFILLDFFLNKPNTYLAFDFIDKIAVIKNSADDLSTNWYFITSSVFNSVSQYSRSGLLAENYESTIVDPGDDPTNKKRQIIFIYKLITFMKSRLRTYMKVWDNVSEVFQCNKDQFNSDTIQHCKKCIDMKQVAVKKYLAEFDNLKGLFYDEGPGTSEPSARHRNLINLVDETLRSFKTLPEADWQIIQHQIEHLNVLAEKDIAVKSKFSCNYIKKEIQRRSNIY